MTTLLQEQLSYLCQGQKVTNRYLDFSQSFTKLLPLLFLSSVIYGHLGKLCKRTQYIMEDVWKTVCGSRFCG